MKLALLVLAAVVAGAAALAAPVRMEADVPALRSTVSALWAESAVDADPTATMRITIHMKHSEAQKAALHRVHLSVSDPSHPKYGQHMSQAALADLMSATPAALATVERWLLRAGVPAENIVLSAHRDVFHVTAPVGLVEALLQTDVVAFEHVRQRGTKLLRAAEAYYLPADVAKVVSMVGDIMRLPSLETKAPEVVLGATDNVGGSGTWPNDCSASACKGLVTPGVLRSRYKLAATADAVKGNTMGVAEFQMQYYNPSSLDAFNSKCGVDSTPATVVGGNTPSQEGVEAVLDIEYIKAAAPEIPLTVWYNGEYSLLTFGEYLNNEANPALVWSVSYGNDEAQQTGVAYMDQVNTQFQKASARGLSILFAAGDQGTCGREGCGWIFKKYHPDFPAGSPFVTAVGGTDFASYSIGDETTWSEGGGGFSNTFGIPSWQTDAVAAYKSEMGSSLPNSGWWNNTGRGYPDVSALAGQKTPYCVAAGGTFEGVAGTSASSPVVAGLFARLNGIRLAAGKAPLGFLNPLIYQHPEAFNDVLSGNNGFAAAKGWDPATGMGTPNYEALAKIVAGLP